MNISQGFEETLHEVFVRSKGEKSLEEARARFQRESEEYQEELARIEEQLRELRKKVRVAFMVTDFDRWDELKRRRGYLCTWGSSRYTDWAEVSSRGCYQVDERGGPCWSAPTAFF